MVRLPIGRERCSNGSRTAVTDRVRNGWPEPIAIRQMNPLGRTDLQKGPLAERDCGLQDRAS